MSTGSAPESIRCPDCGQANRPSRRFCAQCGGRFDPVCAECGERNEPGERFCGQCGFPLEAGRASPRTPATPAQTPGEVRPLGGSAPVSTGDDTPSISGGRYRVERFLGEGAKKRVFLAHDTRLDRPVAVAILKTEGLAGTGLDRVRREAEAMGRLGDHPNVVTVFDVEEDRDQVFIVSAYVPGGDVQGHMREAPDHRLPVTRAIGIAADIAGALQHAHEHGVIHRDVKPSNVWLAEDGSALLGDFGLASLRDGARLTQEGTMLGTVAYMPPEQALGRTADARSDLYSLGATLYEMLAGRPPFAGDDTVAVIAQHINSPAVRPSWHEKTVPRDLDALVLQLLSKDPDERPESAGLVVDALTAIATRLKHASPSDNDSRSGETLPPATLGQFVGRGREMTQLQALLARVLSGQGSVAMVVGEPGIGKTRLAREFSVHARLHGAEVVMGPCYEGEASLPYLPFREAIREYARRRDDETLLVELGEGAPEIATLAPEIRERFPDLPEAPPLEGEAERQRLFESMTAFLSRAARGAPLVLHLDDLHWADKPSLLLMLHLARRLRNDRVFLLGTYRDVELERTHPLAETLAKLRTGGLYERVLLRGLSLDGVRELLRARSGHEVPERIVERLLEETEGNPFFVEEVIKHLIEIGAIHREGGEWIGDPSLVDRSIPEGVREVIGYRLSRLSEPCNAMLTVGSAMTGGFSYELISTLCEGSEEEVLDRLEEALRAQVIRERGEETRVVYEFSHALMRQTLYHELSTPRRVRLHRQVGEALETLYGLDSEPHLAALAYHFFQGAPGGDVQKAIDMSMRAARRALELLAWEDAAAHTTRALEALEMKAEASERERFDLIFGLGEAQRLAGERAKSRETLGRAAGIARSLGDSELLARSALAYASEDVIVQFDSGDVVALLEEGLAAIGPEDSTLRARLLSRLSIGLIFSSDTARCEALGAEAVEVARRLGDPWTIGRSLIIYPIVARSMRDFDRREALIRELTERAEESGDRELLLNGGVLATTLAIDLGHGDEVDRVMDRYAELAAELRQPALLWFSAIRRAMLALCRGPMDEAMQLVDQAREIGQRCEHPLSEVFYAWQCLVTDRLRGSPGPAAGRALTIYESVLGAVSTTGGGRASFLLSSGRVEEAHESFEATARQHFKDILQNSTWLCRVCLAADVCVQLADAARAAELYPMLLPFERYVAFTGPAALCAGPVSHTLARLASLMGHYDEAVAHFETALERLDRLRFGVLGAQLRLDFARTLLSRAASGDPGRALDLARKALDLAEELGMAAVVEEAVALKLELQGAETSGVKDSVILVAEAVETRRPDLGSHAAPDGTVTLLFSDMEGFTAMTERLGDLRAREVIRQHNRVVREQLVAHGGYEVELQGDGFLLAFGSARQGLLCAVAIQRAFAKHNATRPPEPIRVRIGVHTGEALKDADKFFGKTVILTARIAAAAKGGEILASAIVRELTASTGDLHFGAERDENLKGISKPQRLVQVEWA